MDNRDALGNKEGTLRALMTFTGFLVICGVIAGEAHRYYLTGTYGEIPNWFYGFLVVEVLLVMNYITMRQIQKFKILFQGKLPSEDWKEVV